LGNFHAHCRIHSGIKPYKCDNCDKEFSLKHNFNRHYRIHTGEKNFKCIKCERAFVTKAHLHYHLNKTHQIYDENAFKCNQCDKTFVTESHFNFHLNKAHPPISNQPNSSSNSSNKVDESNSNTLVSKFKHELENSL